MSDVVDLETKKELAKIGMVAAMGATVFTTPFMKRNKAMRKLHVGAGLALVGFSLWHHQLYQPPRRRSARKREAGED